MCNLKRGCLSPSSLRKLETSPVSLWVSALGLGCCAVLRLVSPLLPFLFPPFSHLHYFPLSGHRRNLRFQMKNCWAGLSFPPSLGRLKSLFSLLPLYCQLAGKCSASLCSSPPSFLASNHSLSSSSPPFDPKVQFSTSGHDETSFLPPFFSFLSSLLGKETSPCCASKIHPLLFSFPKAICVSPLTPLRLAACREWRYLTFPARSFFSFPPPTRRSGFPFRFLSFR